MMRFLCFLRGGDNGTCNARGAALFLSGRNSSNQTHSTALYDIPPSERPWPL